VGDVLPLGPVGLGIPSQVDTGYLTTVNAAGRKNEDTLMDYLVALNVSDLQFEYRRSSGSWTGDGDWNCNVSCSSNTGAAVVHGRATVIGTATLVGYPRR